MKTVESILSAAGRAGIEIQSDRLRVSQAGLDFLAVFATDRSGTAWVLRAPRRRDVLERAEHEARVLRLVAPHLPVAVPDWRVRTPELIAYPLLPGAPAAEVDPEAGAYVWHVDPQALAPAFPESVGRTLAALHAIDTDAVRAAGLDVLDMQGARQKIAADMDRVRREIGVGDALWDRWQAWLATDAYWPSHATFTHGDFHAGHLLVDTEERLVGVLDWTEGAVSDPTTDLAVFQMVFGDAAFAAMLDAYVAAGGQTWPRLADHVAETIAAYPYKIGLFALTSGLPEYMEMARSTLTPRHSP